MTTETEKKRPTNSPEPRRSIPRSICRSEVVMPAFLHDLRRAYSHHHICERRFLYQDSLTGETRDSQQRDTFFFIAVLRMELKNSHVGSLQQLRIILKKN